MGACGSSMTAEEKAEAQRNRELEAAQKKQRQLEESKLKLLLLGAGESGKSTLFKQMKILFSKQHGFTQSEVQAGIKVVYSNIISNMKILVSACENHAAVEDTELAEEIMGLDECAAIDSKLGEKLKAIWTDPGVVETWKNKSDIQVQDALEYFMDHIDRIAASDYLPSNEDILRYRVRTSGIVEAEFNINGALIALFDVGGQRNERKKWIHCFDNVTAVIFVAAISEYDQVLYEDQTKNRQEEALELFQEQCASQWFANKSMILFLNKRDVFRQKLLISPFKVPGIRNEDYTGAEVVAGTASADPNSPEFEKVYQDSCNYLISKYKKAGQNDKSKREIYIKVTCATDTDQVKTVMESCKDIILKANLSDNGFM